MTKLMHNNNNDNYNKNVNNALIWCKNLAIIVWENRAKLLHTLRRF